MCVFTSISRPPPHTHVYTEPTYGRASAHSRTLHPLGAPVWPKPPPSRALAAHLSCIRFPVIYYVLMTLLPKSDLDLPMLFWFRCQGLACPGFMFLQRVPVESPPSVLRAFFLKSKSHIFPIIFKVKPSPLAFSVSHSSPSTLAYSHSQ